ncbi:hypothetical protein FJU08_12975 [Martelella alba]|uniref:Uncharacterized protein n=1 Tax=Martelella alba TaxID=2590451 RepID=A0A506UAU4_9HYPH|nr:hypothetical protein [Martelella alba]TPW29719.1 hypothetical protein FJU08_12975 [Martelella alba]
MMAAMRHKLAMTPVLALVLAMPFGLAACATPPCDQPDICDKAEGALPQLTDEQVTQMQDDLGALAGDSAQ